MQNKANSNPKTTQFRIHYKKLFKTVEQIAKEASDNVATLQALPSTPNDFGLGKCAPKPLLCETYNDECQYEFEQNQDELKEQEEADPLIFNHFEHVIEQANQMFDDCYEDFEKKADQLIVNQNKSGKYKDHVKILKQEGESSSSSSQSGSSSSFQSPSSSQRSQQKDQNQNQRRSLEREFKLIKENYTIDGFQDKFTKRPATAFSPMKAHFQTTAKSISPQNRKRELQQPHHFTDKWAHFLQETDKSLEKYQKRFDDCYVMKKGKSLASKESEQPQQPLPLRAVRCVTAGGEGGFNSKMKRSSSSRASNQMIMRQQEQSVQIQLFQIVGLLKKELKESKEDNSVNLKEVFLCEKAMDLLLQSVNTSPIDIIADIFQVNKQYIIVHDQKIINKITQFLQIFSKTKRYVYREICELLLKRLEEQEDQLKEQKQINEQLNQNLKELNQKHIEEIQKSKNTLDAQQIECDAKIKQSCGSLNQQLQAARSEIQTLTETVLQLNRQVLTMRSDNSYQMKQTTQEHDHRQVKLLSQLHQLQETKNDCDLQFNQQKDYLTDLINSHSSAIIKLKLNKETIELQNEKINQLLSEISRLNVRASTQFVNLTPRPSFTELEDICKSINDPSFRNNELLPRSKHPVMKYSEDDSISKLKKLSKTIKTGFEEYKDYIQRLKDQADTSQHSNNSKLKKQIKNQLSWKGGSNRGSEKKIQIDKRNQLGSNAKGTRKNEIIESDQAPMLSNNLLNLSDNLSLSSQDKLALQRQSIDDYEGSFNDFLETKGGKQEGIK